MQPENEWLRCPSVALQIEMLERELRDVVKQQDGSSTEIALHLINGGGKRLRPALVLLAGQLGKADPAVLMRAAIAMELMHVASLYHDDVMDRAATRRGLPSTNRRWGNVLAISGGTLLFARAMAVLASLGDEVNCIASAAAVKLCVGQLQEVENAYNVALTEDDYLSVLESKTATLFELPCRLGGFLAGVSDQTAAALQRYARAVGLAFQLADDILDLSGDEAELGKPVCTDIREGVYSYPIIYALQHSKDGLHQTLRKARLTEAELQEVVALVRGHGALKAARDRVRNLIEEAHESLAGIEKGCTRDSLHELAEFASRRSH